MIIKSTRHVNLHSPSFNGTRADQLGLVHVPANQAVRVPDDVEDHPGFDLLVKDGTVTIHRGGKKNRAKSRPTDEQIQAARSQTDVRGKEPQIKPLEDEDSPLQTSQTASQIPQAPSASSDDSDEPNQEKETAPEQESTPSLIPSAEAVDEDEDSEDSEDSQEEETESK